MRPCTVRINLAALDNNLAVVKRLAPHSQVVAMIKANGYGHGSVEVALHLQSEVAYFGVASIDEAITLREANIQTPILLLEGCFYCDEWQLAKSLNLSLVIHSKEQLDWYITQSRHHDFDIWLKIDTGMHRLGLDVNLAKEELLKLLSVQSKAEPIKLMTHFACADQPLHELNQIQIEQFCQLANQYPQLQCSLANSAGICVFSELQQAYVRPGIMLYGSSPVEGTSADALGLQPVMYFESEIIAIRECMKGDTVGYGATWQSKQNCMIATVAVGYGDGYPRHISKQAYVMIDDIKCPVVGRVSMDMITVDVSTLSGCHIGQQVQLWGDKISIDTVAEFSNTNSYDLLCRTSLRAHREYD